AHGSRRRIVAELQQITAAGAELTGQVQIADRRRLEGEVHVSVRDIAQPTSAAEAFLGRARGTLLPASVGGTATVDARLGGTVDHPIALANTAAPSLSIGSASGIAVAADLAFEPATLTVMRGEANWDGMHAGLSGTVGLTGTQRLDLVLDADAPDLELLNRAADTSPSPVSGAVTAHGTIGGAIARPLATITLAHSAMGWYCVVRTLPARCHISPCVVW